VFLDVDGTLLDIAETPDAVEVDSDLIDLLRHLSIRSDGAVALISGRTITKVDALFEPLLLPVAGLHGFERRNAVGVYSRYAGLSGRGLQQIREMMFAVSSLHPALVLEDKRFSLALHYRRAPQLEEQVREAVSFIVEHSELDLNIISGRMVVEVGPGGANKASAIAQFMREELFKGRLPVFLGDDLTDECAFEWINASGGVSIAVDVDRDSVASVHLPSVDAARRWLQQLVGTSH
jgi:trehalose 6-phosphate phosphatase